MKGLCPSYYLMCLKIVEGMANSVDPDRKPHFPASDLGQSCLLRTVNCLSKYLG